ncbi:MAG: bifunctional DNA-formamidopyrimidine glycosylase/DNA-(apurinic or apyrimidinic site) lyase [Streptosporangiales bacterium]|nr:bifunctional DNA-formamidopyrimidine glycosylase/DNA-(apurinic or apyrimidinic site) lyase [Streptosporangiales bacterium]
MPELPEVEVVRTGLARWVVGRPVEHVEVRHPRAVRRHVAGDADFAARLRGRRIEAAHRRGKYLWLPLDAPDVLVGHLGMSGQLLVVEPGAPDGPHLRVRVAFADGAGELRFVDQRTFGGLFVAPAAERPGDPPAEIAHIARDPLDPGFDEDAFFRTLRRRRTGLKRALLDQSFVSGVGNIYADEALWQAGLHGARATEGVTRAESRRVVAGVRAVMAAALTAGGTSFDSLYVNVNGESGYFDRSLHVYGREGEPCDECGTPIRREAFMNRSSYTCPRCQPRPRRAR